MDDGKQEARQMKEFIEALKAHLLTAGLADATVRGKVCIESINITIEEFADAWPTSENNPANYAPSFNEAEHAELTRKGREAWADVPSATGFVEELRGNQAQIDTSPAALMALADEWEDCEPSWGRKEEAGEAMVDALRAVADEKAQAVPIAWVPVHPKYGPLWSNATDSPSPERLPSYPLMPLYAAPQASEAQAVPRGYVKVEDTMDVTDVFATLCDLVAEANAVDTVIGRPQLLLHKLTKLRDTVGSAVNGAILAAPQASEASRAQRLRDAGIVRRDECLQCEMCGAKQPSWGGSQYHNADCPDAEGPKP